MPRNLLNALLFIAGWLACLLGGGLWLWGVAAALLVHLIWIGIWQREGKLLMSALLFGSAVESFLLQLGVFDFGEPRQLIPLRQALIWLLVGTTLCQLSGLDGPPLVARQPARCRTGAAHLRRQPVARPGSPALRQCRHPDVTGGDLGSHAAAAARLCQAVYRPPGLKSLGGEPAWRRLGG